MYFEHNNQPERIISMEMLQQATNAVEDFLNNVEIDEWQRGYYVDHKQRYLADLKLILDNVTDNTLLEVGAAPGHMTALMKACGINVTGVDLNPERVSNIITAFDMDIRQCDVEREPLPFEDETFDFIVFNEIFEHLRIDPPFVLCELNRILQPGGKLMLTTPNLYSLPSIARFLTGRSIADPVIEYSKLRNMGHMGHVREYSAHEVSRCLFASGFSPCYVNYRFHANYSGKKKALLSTMYRLVPSRFYREIVVMAEKTSHVPRLTPVVPLIN
ncbi:class I SAM-dependent methyltransferase [Aliiglaciecola litoralis]|uniref:Methyltransferase domain-containing protein n=1 Tax=Aliiglaciecola litoralis TaxID=582857 RepID=A0ABP3X3P6_9ALTE